MGIVLLVLVKVKDHRCGHCLVVVIMSDGNEGEDCVWSFCPQPRTRPVFGAKKQRRGGVFCLIENITNEQHQQKPRLIDGVIANGGTWKSCAIIECDINRTATKNKIQNKELP